MIGQRLSPTDMFSLATFVSYNMLSGVPSVMMPWAGGSI